MRNIVVSSFTCIALISLSIFTTACGGGGGDDEVTGAARVRIQASPSTIDTGDRTLVRTNISELHRDGILLKFFYPEGLDFVLDSATLEIDGRELSVFPAFNGLDERGIYLVFFLGEEEFGTRKEGILRFELEANDAVNDGEITVDADVDDRLISNDEEFDVSNPEFEPEDGASIDVRS